MFDRVDCTEVENELAAAGIAAVIAAVLQFRDEHGVPIRVTFQGCIGMQTSTLLGA